MVKKYNWWWIEDSLYVPFSLSEAISTIQLFSKSIYTKTDNLLYGLNMSNMTYLKNRLKMFYPIELSYEKKYLHISNSHNTYIFKC
jgi:hypothetical protein